MTTNTYDQRVVSTIGKIQQLLFGIGVLLILFTITANAVLINYTTSLDQLRDTVAEYIMTEEAKQKILEKDRVILSQMQRLEAQAISLKHLSSENAKLQAQINDSIGHKTTVMIESVKSSAADVATSTTESVSNAYSKAVDFMSNLYGR